MIYFRAAPLDLQDHQDCPETAETRDPMETADATAPPEWLWPPRSTFPADASSAHLDPRDPTVRLETKFPSNGKTV